MDESVTVGHWRTSDGDEVDLVLEFEDGRLLALEVKAGERISGKNFRGLNKLRDAFGSRFLAGVVLVLGPRSYSLSAESERMHVMPIDRLWRPVGRLIGRE